ncbi:MAG: hypothetical protein OXI33_15580 [Chloroflexota bacterium]|nr:hypothetical protein [Chloroflexota bacterium]
MAYQANPFLERLSERTSDEEFVRLFSPKILERLEDDTFEGGVHIFRSPPGGGKTTLLRAFTPTALRAFWNARHVQEIAESYQRLVAHRVLDRERGPQLLGVFLSCASGYADLPRGADASDFGLFRALFDCRVVLRSLRSLARLLRMPSTEELDAVRVEYDDSSEDLQSIPRSLSISGLLDWAENHERSVYTALDSMIGPAPVTIVPHVRFESVLWLQSVRFVVDGDQVAPRRMLLVDDLHKLQRKQRSMFIQELTEARPQMPLWLSERTIALGTDLLSQGTREGRELRHYELDALWSSAKGQHQFAGFGQNILDRRLQAQNEVPPGTFSQYIRNVLLEDDVRNLIGERGDCFRDEIAKYRKKPRYVEWVAQAEHLLAAATVADLRSLFTTCILLARDESKRQLSLELEPLSIDELDQRDSSQIQGASDIFLHERLQVPHYFGIERLCVMATSNVDELLSLAAFLYEGLRSKQILRRDELYLSPAEQENLLTKAARRKRDFIPKNHTEGARAQRLLDSIGSYCRERTFLPNAPYAPGVTGIRLSQTQLSDLHADRLKGEGRLLEKVLAECVAENLLTARESSASTSRESGTVFYLNRTFCALYGLPLQMGGWQDVSLNKLITWMQRGSGRKSKILLEAD